MSCFNLKSTLVVFLAFAITAHASDCGDGSDGSVANCCDANNGSCDNCAAGYGLSDDNTQCNKCKVRNCFNCDGNVAVCKIFNKPAIPNCEDSYDGNNSCFECEDGYSLTRDKKSCVKCSANCDICTKPNTCKTCTPFYGLAKNGKCTKCKTPNCYYCASNLVTCTQCNGGYGVQKGKCVNCRPGAASCDNGVVVCPAGKGPDGKGGCKNCPDRLCASCVKGPCDKCYNGGKPVNGSCKGV
ncbi:hypothetical protein Ndes2526A_g02346 [Nannochloris sp. 'desiccata']